MDSELKSLEKKVNRLICLYQKARSENIKLRQQLSESNTANEMLAGKIHVATNRLEMLLTNIPENIK